MIAKQEGCWVISQEHSGGGDGGVIMMKACFVFVLTLHIINDTMLSNGTQSLLRSYYNPPYSSYSGLPPLVVEGPELGDSRYKTVFI